MIWSSNSNRSLASARTWCCLTMLLLFWTTGTSAHVPVPDSVLAPKTPAEAWNVIRLSTDNVERLLRESRLAEVPDQISLCSPALRALPRWAVGSPVQATQAAEQAVRAAVEVSSLAQASVAGDRATALNLFGSLREKLAKLAANYDAPTVRADIFYCPMHPDFLSADPGAHCAKCGMPMLPRRIPYSFIYVPPGEPTLRLTAAADSSPVKGREVHVKIRLERRDGSPVLLPDLLVMHTQPIHLLIVDASLEDYHHEHPAPTGKPGEYAFSFTPAKEAIYRVFADVVPADTGVQEYPFTDLSGGGNPVPPSGPRNRPSTFAATAGGLNFHLDFEETDGSPPRAGQARALHIMVSDPTGAPLTTLGPVMSAYAHLVGFYDDGRTVIHLHPAGGEILDPQARGGPVLDFRLYPPKAGFLRLYCQVQVGRRMIFAPFDVNISP